MKTVYSEKHRLHAPKRELCDGEMVENFEKPARAEYVLSAVAERRLGEIIEPEIFDARAFEAVHSPRYIDFLKNAWSRWEEIGKTGDAFPFAFNTLHPESPVPNHIFGQLGYFISDGAVPVTPTTWAAVKGSAFVALTGAQLIGDGEHAAFSLCRPPGHHAAKETASGYCFLNNAAIAAQSLRDSGAKRVAVLDVDYHHGNGTQDLFYERDDVLFVSIHADPAVEYPFFLGYACETGRGAGEGFNINYPLPVGADYARYDEALSDAMAQIRDYGPEALVVSLGVDTFAQDPISGFRLESPDYLRMGGRISKVPCPALFVMEGGYAVEEIGTNVANVLDGYLQG
ncbi:MAG: histone deacetylase family protein [Alphaproteobacteria bacterium]|nr:histone deacetylase family protein [Alphaproteobacteria bacterium]